MDENNVVENEVMDQANEIVEDSQVTKSDVALTIGGVAVLAAAGYGMYQLGKKAVTKIKSKINKKSAEDKMTEIPDPDDGFEEFEEETEIHVVK